ncbi:MAG: hypothetical protein ACRCXS_08655, partial [Cetobacterium sp.]
MAESLVLEREKNIEKKTLKQFLRNKEVQKKLLLITFLFIPTVMLLSFIIYPALKLVYISLTDWNGISESYNFIGFENFKTLFTSKSLWTTLKANSIYFTLHF